MYIFTTIATILMSGVIATIATYRLNTNRDHIFFMRQKAEELYLAAGQYDKILSGYVLTNYPLFKNKITYDE